ncbi:MAG TPA: hypothetical protein VGF30_11680, partial [Bacteroidia bacterium]
MKKLIILFMLCYSVTQAQSNGKFFADTCYWYVYDWNYNGNPMFNPPTYRHEYQRVEGDTIDNNKIYQKVYRKTFPNTTVQPIDPLNFNFVGYYLHDSNKVFFGSTLTNMSIVYDFNLTPVDSFLFQRYDSTNTPVYKYVKVNTVDSVLYGGIWRKRITFNPMFSTYLNYTSVAIRWVE